MPMPRHSLHRYRGANEPKPAWWPETEAWPPEYRWPMQRSPFLRRMGCMFGILVLTSLTIFLVMLGVVLNTLGVIRFHAPVLPWVLPLAGLFLLLMASLFVSTARSLRRITRPLDEMLKASEQVASGDYSVRVDERGLPEVRLLARGFNSMAARLQESSSRRRDMLADVSHELRTPLTVIQGNVEGMLDGLYAADEKTLKSILEETQILSRLVEDLRTLALAESGALQLKREPVQLKDLIEEAVAAHSSLAEAAGVELAVEGSSPQPMELDPLRVREILSNLLANAIRYTRRGGRVRIILNGGTISVEDEGPGIPPEDLPHIFERYYKSSDSGGMGLGLSIARYLVEAHGGSIHAESAPGKGTKINLSLPQNP